MHQNHGVGEGIVMEADWEDVKYQADYNILDIDFKVFEFKRLILLVTPVLI